MIGSWELVVIFFIVLLLFGGKRLPQLAKSLGDALREFKKASQSLSDDVVTKDATVEKDPVGKTSKDD